jgi:hypothetical protein
MGIVEPSPLTSHPEIDHILQTLPKQNMNHVSSKNVNSKDPKRGFSTVNGH